MQEVAQLSQFDEELYKVGSLPLASFPLLALLSRFASHVSCVHL